MKVLGIGLPKTGTTSLHRAFEILGYDSVHAPGSWESMIKHEAASDLAAVWWYRRVWDEFPDCKFILTTRSPESWLESCESHFEKAAPTEDLLRWRERIFGRETFWKYHWIEAWNQHAEAARSFFRTRSHAGFMTYAVMEGWSPLCRFLDKPIPDVPFPWENKRGEP